MRKGDIRKQSIIDASEKLFSEKGYLETTVEDILSVLDCSKGSFYHYFDSKLSVLTAICREKVEKWMDQYRHARVTSTREKLNALLFYTLPFRPEEEEFLFTLLRLRSRGESTVTEGTLRDAQREIFKPELENLLMILNETGQAHISRPHLEDLVFEMYTAFYDEMCESIRRCVEDGSPVGPSFRETVDAARFLWERVLDMDYGSLELVRLDDFLPVAAQLVQRLRNI